MNDYKYHYLFTTFVSVFTSKFFMTCKLKIRETEDINEIDIEPFLGLTGCRNFRFRGL